MMDAFAIKEWLTSHGHEPVVTQTTRGQRVISFTLPGSFDCDALAGKAVRLNSDIAEIASIMVTNPEIRILPFDEDGWLDPLNVAAMWLEDLLSELDHETIEQIVQSWQPPAVENALAYPYVPHGTITENGRDDC